MLEQAELVALVIRQQQQGSAAAKRFRALVQARSAQRLDGGYSYLQLERMAYYVHKDSYRKSVKQHITELQQNLQPITPSPSKESHDACRQS